MDIFQKINDNTWVCYDSDDCPDFKHFIINMGIFIGIFIFICFISYLTM